MNLQRNEKNMEISSSVYFDDSATLHKILYAIVRCVQQIRHVHYSFLVLSTLTNIIGQLCYCLHILSESAAADIMLLC